MRLLNISMKKWVRRDHLAVKELKYAVIDIEATGPNIINGDRIIQIAAIIYQNNEKIKEYNMLINPEIAIPPQISKLTGIEQEDVMNAPKLESVITLWYERLKDCIFIGHNLAFDLRIMKEVFSQYDFSFSPLAIDTFLLSKIIYPMSKGYGLSDLADYFRLELIDAHNALVDAQFTSALVNKIAQSITLLPSQLRDEFINLAAYLPNNEKLIFDFPEYFINDSEMSPLNIDTPQHHDTDHVDLLTDYIHEQWQKRRHLVIENTNFPLKQEMLFFLSLKMGVSTPLIIVVQNEHHIQKWQKYFDNYEINGFMTLKKRNRYLNIQLLEAIKKRIEPASLNQTELITWMALIHYHEVFEITDLSFINKELKIVELLHKLAEDYQIEIPPNTTYYDQVQAIKQNHMTIMSIGTFLQLYENDNQLKILPDSACIFFENAKQLLEIGLLFQQEQIDLSQMMNRFQEVLDNYQSNSASPDLVDQKVIVLIRKMASQIHQLILFLEQNDLDTVSNQRKVTRYLSKNNQAFIDKLQYLFQLNHHLLMSKSLLVKNDRLLEDINQLSLMSQLTQQNTNNYYWSFAGDVVNEKLYHVQIILNRVRWSHDFWDNISVPFSYLLVSPGNYHYKEAFGIYNRLGAPNGYYLKLNESSRDPITFQMPALYLSEEIMDNNKDTLISNINTFIKQQNNDRYLIIVSNQDELLDYHRIFSSDEELLGQYLIQIRGTHGSVRRLINRIKNEHKFILILTMNDLQSSEIENMPNNLIVLLEKLPFLSPERPELQAFGELIQDERLIFEEMNLPMMAHRIKKMLMILGEHHDYYLFDDRVFTRTYSKQLQELLRPFIQFEWRMD